MDKKITFIKFCYWLGVILDARAAIKLIQQRYIELPEKINTVVSGKEFIDSVYSVGQDVALMFGWTFLLIWAVRKPIERRGVLFLTIFPVLIGLIINAVNGFLYGFIALKNVIPLLLGQSVLVVLFAIGYVVARNIENNKI
jgi:hypothetical protein